MDKTTIIFISYGKPADYELAFELWHERIITMLEDPF